MYELKYPLQTSMDDLERYDFGVRIVTKLFKKKEVCQRESDISQRSKYFDRDYKLLLDHKMKLKQKESLEKQLRNIEGYVDGEIGVHLKILEDENFIKSNVMVYFKEQREICYKFK